LSENFFGSSASEDRHNVLNATHMSAKLCGFLPHEIIFDKSSVTKTDEFKNVKEQFAVRGCDIKFSEDGNPKYKSQMERWFRTFQNELQRLISGFSGGGITGTVKNERIDKNHIQFVVKKNGYPSYNQMQKAIAEAIVIWNANPRMDGLSPNDKFKQAEKQNIIPVEPFEIALIFWNQKKLKVKKMAVKFTVQHVEYNYDLQGEEKKGNNKRNIELSGSHVHVYYDLDDMSIIHVFDLKGRYVGDFTQKVPIVLSGANQSEADKKRIMGNSKRHKSITAKVDKELQELVGKAAKSGDPEILFRDHGPTAIFKDCLNDAESKLMLEQYSNMKGIDFDNTPDIQNVKPDSPLNNPDYGKNQFECENTHTKKATLEPVEQKNTI